MQVQSDLIIPDIVVPQIKSSGFLIIQINSTRGRKGGMAISTACSQRLVPGYWGIRITEIRINEVWLYVVLGVFKFAYFTNYRAIQDIHELFWHGP